MGDALQDILEIIMDPTKLTTAGIIAIGLLAIALWTLLTGHTVAALIFLIIGAIIWSKRTPKYPDQLAHP